MGDDERGRGALHPLGHERAPRPMCVALAAVCEQMCVCVCEREREREREREEKSERVTDQVAVRCEHYKSLGTKLPHALSASLLPLCVCVWGGGGVQRRQL